MEVRDNRRPVHLVNPDGLSPPIGFSHIAIADGFVWIGGQTAADSSGHIVAKDDLAVQFESAIRNVATALNAAGCRAEDIIKLTYFVTDIDAYRANLKPIGSAYRAVFGRHFPASTLIAVTNLVDPAAMIEIECVARLPEAGG